MQAESIAVPPFAIKHLCRRLARERPLLAHVHAGAPVALEQALLAEETAERRRDKEYWLPLKAELEKLRHAK